MTIKHINRRGDIYYLHEGKTKKGNPMYYFSMKKDGVLVNTIPKGYEIYENPNAQVFLRMIPPKIIADEEIATVEKGIKKYSELKDFKIDVRKNEISVYLPDKNTDQLKQMKDDILSVPEHRSPEDINKIERILNRSVRYDPGIRFVLIDKKTREFKVEKFYISSLWNALLGSKDKRAYLDSSRNLAELVKKYAPHPGKESFFELP
jgi:hypothetical protein